jgi:hypothetical protein
MSAPAILFDVFFKRFGIRSPQYLVAPRMPSIDKFFFPKESIHHSISYDGVTRHPSSEEYLYRDISKKIFVNHVFELADKKGDPRKVAIPLLPLARDFHIKNKRFRLAEDPSAIKDENTLVTVNYGFAPLGYRYMKSFYAEYYKWWNTEYTLWDKVSSLTTTSNRNHFIFVNLPKVIPSVSRLNIFSKIFNQELIKRFNTPELLFLLEIWKWLSADDRPNSMLGKLSQEQLNKINIIYQESGRFILLNLGQLNLWRDDPANSDQKIKIKPDSLQKRFLKMLMVLMENRTVVNSDNVETEISDSSTEDENSDIEENPIPKINTLMPEESSSDIDFVIDDSENFEAEDSKLKKIDNALANLDSDLQTLEILEKEREDREVLQIEQDEKAAQDRQVSITHSDKVIEFEYFNKELKPEDRIIALCEELADDGLMSASEYRKFVNASSNYKSLSAPYDSNKSIEEYSKIDPSEIAITESKKTVDRETILDKTMLSSSLLEFDERYITKILPKDVTSMVSNIQNAGLIISKYELETVEDILGKYEIHTVRVVPVQGQPSTLRFKIPFVNEDGTYTSSGIKYRLRKQRGDLPIRKISPDRVALTSYYGKTFVTRSDKKVNDYGHWLRSQILSKGIDNQDNSVINIVPADVFDNSLDLPRIYTTVAMAVSSFSSNGFDFIFDYHNRHKFFDEGQLNTYEKDGAILIAHSAIGDVIVMDNNGYLYKGIDGNLEQLGSLESFLDIDTLGSPVDFAQLKVYGKNIPLVVVLGYMYGLEELIKVLKADVRRVSSGQRQNLQEHEYAISFSDETLIFSKDNALATLIFSGFKEYARHIKNYSVYTFDKPNVYFNILESNGIGIRFLRELDLMDKLFIDPITKEILIEMGEPTTFRGLIVRGAQLLLKDSHPDALDMQFMRIKGYERFAGAIYTEMVNAIREHNSKSGKSNYPIELNPYAVWKRITTDPSINLVSDINPIENLKQQEAVTYSGVGGRMARSMTKSSRAYHPNDMGVISEATSDSSDVAINTYTSADPQFVSLRGRTKKFDLENPNPTSLLSTSALLSVSSDSDDPKRVNFVSIQHSHGVACDGYRQSSVRTGYEQVLAQRTSDLFAYSARFKGRVLAKKNNSILIEYEDGTKKGIELGRRYGAAAGLTIAHDIVSDMMEGQTFEKGDIIAYNKGFFEKDILNPNNVIWKMGVVAKTVLWESPQTHEDASAISRKLADKLTTKITKVKQVVVRFDQEIKEILSPGNSVEHRTILCTIEDPVTSNAGLFDENTLSSLQMFSNQTPLAKTKGVLEKIEIFYNGEKEDMSSSLRALADASDRALGSKLRSLGKTSLTGQVDESFRIDGDPLQLDHLVIKFYLTSDVSSGVGDKGVFANQMKTVFSEVMSYEMRTESGEEIDAVFGQKSIDDRIVISALTIGTTNTLLDVIAKEAVKLYKGN